MSIVEIKEVDLLRVLSGDIIVVKHPSLITLAEFERINESSKRLFPDNKVVILEGGLELSAVRVLGDYSDADTSS